MPENPILYLIYLLLMKKTYLLILLCTGLMAMKPPQKKEDLQIEKTTTLMADPVQAWSFIEISKIIKSEFPMAYDEFMEISFYQQEEKIIPGTATFLIPATYFKKELTQEVLDKKAEAILKKMDASACQSIHVGEVEEYSFYKWSDKTVRKVTLHFLIGC
jgi:hypothetical protein